VESEVHAEEIPETNEIIWPIFTESEHETKHSDRHARPYTSSLSTCIHLLPLIPSRWRFNESDVTVSHPSRQRHS
jgi:hypothetical protein